MSLECSGGCSSAARSFSTVAYTRVVKFRFLLSQRMLDVVLLRLRHSPQAKVILLPLKVVTF